MQPNDHDIAFADKNPSSQDAVNARKESVACGAVQSVRSLFARAHPGG